jgi:hypothetical protein
LSFSGVLAPTSEKHKNISVFLLKDEFTNTTEKVKKNGIMVNETAK